MELGIRVEELSGSALAVLASVSVLMIVIGGITMLCAGYSRRSSQRLRLTPCPAATEYEEADPGLCPHLANAIRVEINRYLPPNHPLPMLDIRGAPRRPLAIRRRGGHGASSPPPAAPIEPPIEHAYRKVAAALVEHLPALARRRRTLVTMDEHGRMDDRAWRAECLDVLDRLTRQTLTTTEAEAFAAAGPGLLPTALLDDPGWSEWAWRASTFSYHSGLRPSEYVAVCAARLDAAGWTCWPGPDGVDADIVARKGGVIVALRCVKTGSGIAGRLVQEAAAAKARLGADIAALVTNAPFSRDALDLARATGTILLNHAELDVLDSRLSPPASPPAGQGSRAPRLGPGTVEEIWPC